MIVIGLFHTADGTESAGAHAAHLAWLPGILASTVATLAIVCVVSAVRTLREVGVACGTLPVVAACAMAVMTAAMLLPF